MIRAHSRCRIPRLRESGDSHYSLVILRGSHTTRIQNDQCPECRKNRKGVPWPSSDFSAFLHSWPTIGMDKQVISDQSRDSSTNLVINRQSSDSFLNHLETPFTLHAASEWCIQPLEHPCASVSLQAVGASEYVQKRAPHELLSHLRTPQRGQVAATAKPTCVPPGEGK